LHKKAQLPVSLIFLGQGRAASMQAASIKPQGANL